MLSQWNAFEWIVNFIHNHDKKTFITLNTTSSLLTIYNYWFTNNQWMHFFRLDCTMQRRNEVIFWERGITLKIMLFIHFQLLIFNVLAAICVCVWVDWGWCVVVLYHMYIKCYIRFCGCLARFLRYKTMFGSSPLYIVL